MYLRILLTIAFTLLTLGCGPKLESNTTTTGQSVAKTYKWKMVTTWPKLPGLGTAPERFAKNVA